jgi:hypothetical protein
MVKKKTPSPRLDTIKMVEKTLNNMDESVIKVSALKRLLPKQVNHNTLLEILDYLQNSHKIFIGTKGISWVHTGPKMKNILAKAYTIPPEDFRKWSGKSNK